MFRTPVYELIRSGNDVLEVRADIEHADSASELSLAVELKDGDSARFYRASSLIGRHGPAPSTSSLIVAVKLADMRGHGEGQRLRAYIWNKGKRGRGFRAAHGVARKATPSSMG